MFKFFSNESIFTAHAELIHTSRSDGEERSNSGNVDRDVGIAFGVIGGLALIAVLVYFLYFYGRDEKLDSEVQMAEIQKGKSEEDVML